MATENKYLDKEGLKTFLGLVKENFAVKTEITEISNQITEVTETIETIADLPLENGSGENSMKLKGGGLETNFPNEFAIGLYNVSKQQPNVVWNIVKGVWNEGVQEGAYEDKIFTCGTPNADDACIIRCVLNGVSSISFTYRSDGEEECDYAAIGKLDTVLSNYQTDKAVHEATTEKENKTWKTTTYEVPSGEHFVDFIYGKDAYVDDAPDNAQIYISNIVLANEMPTPLFTIGNGTESEPSNAFEVKSDGSVNIVDIYHSKLPMNLQRELNSFVKREDLPLESGDGINSVITKNLGNIATNRNTFSTGMGCEAKNVYEFACGYYNKSNYNTYEKEEVARNLRGDVYNTLFSIGNGLDENTRHNAFEVKQAGWIYISDVYGAGSANGYDKPMKCIQTELKNAAVKTEVDKQISDLKKEFDAKIAELQSTIDGLKTEIENLKSETAQPQE